MKRKHTSRAIIYFSKEFFSIILFHSFVVPNAVCQKVFPFNVKQIQIFHAFAYEIKYSTPKRMFGSIKLIHYHP